MTWSTHPPTRRTAVAAVALAAVALPFGVVATASAAPPDWQTFETQNGTATLAMPADLTIVDDSELYRDYNATGGPARWMNTMSIVDATGSTVLTYIDHTLFDGTVSEPAAMGVVDSVVIDDTFTAAAWWFQTTEGGPVTSLVSLVPTDMPTTIQDDGLFVYADGGGVSLQGGRAEHATADEATAALESAEAQSLLAIVAEYRFHGGIGSLPEGTEANGIVSLSAEVVNDDGGTMTLDDVMLMLQDAGQATLLEGQSGAIGAVSPGAYSLTSAPVDGYSVVWSCDTAVTHADDGSDPSFEVQAGDDIRCDAVFDDGPVATGTVTLDLSIDIVNDDGGTLSEDDVLVDLVHSDAQGTWDVEAATDGTWTIMAGWVELGISDPTIVDYHEAWTCAGVDGTLDPSPATAEQLIGFETADGETYACTVTLDDIPGATLPEAQFGLDIEVTNDGGGDLAADVVSVLLEWSDPTDDGNGRLDAEDGARYDIVAGTTTLTMPAVAGYAMAIACDGHDGIVGDGAVEADDVVTLQLAAGAVATCTLVLDDEAVQAASATGTLPETGAIAPSWLLAIGTLLFLIGGGVLWLRTRH